MPLAITIVLALIKVSPSLIKTCATLAELWHGNNNEPLPPQATREDLQTVEAVEGIVAGIDAAHPDWPGHLKREYALNAIKIELEKKAIKRKDSELGALIEIYACRLATNRAAVINP